MQVGVASKKPSGPSRLNHLGVVSEMVDDLERKIAVDLSISGAKCACETDVDRTKKQKNGKVFCELFTSPNHSGHHRRRSNVKSTPCHPISEKHRSCPDVRIDFGGTRNSWWLPLICKVPTGIILRVPAPEFDPGTREVNSVNPNGFYPHFCWSRHWIPLSCERHRSASCPPPPAKHPRDRSWVG